jgi:hypothetical protein
VKRKIRTTLSAAFFCTLCWLAYGAASPESQEIAEKPRIYADPEGKFSFPLVGDWIKLPSDLEKGIAGSFVLTKELGGDRKVIAELLISFATLEAAVSLEDYAKTEDRRAMNTPGFKRLDNRGRRLLGGYPALRNRYSFSRQGGPTELQHKLIYQYYLLRDETIWGITVTALRQDESILAEVERTVLDSFQFSVPEGSASVLSEARKKVTVDGPLGGFSLMVPETWEATLSNEQGATIRGPDAVVYAFSLPAEKGDQSPEELTAQFLKERENLKELRVLSQGGGGSGLMNGYAVEYTGTESEQVWRVRLVTFVLEEKVVFLHCAAPEERWPLSSGALRKIQQSLSLGKSSGGEATTQ